MSALTLELPEEVRERIERVTQTQGLSIKEFILRAAADDKAAAIAPRVDLEKRALAARQQVFDKVLASVTEVDPPEWDRID